MINELSIKKVKTSVITLWEERKQVASHLMVKEMDENMSMFLWSCKVVYTIVNLILSPIWGNRFWFPCLKLFFLSCIYCSAPLSSFLLPSYPLPWSPCFQFRVWFQWEPWPQSWWCPPLTAPLVFASQLPIWWLAPLSFRVTAVVGIRFGFPLIAYWPSYLKFYFNYKIFISNVSSTFEQLFG